MRRTARFKQLIAAPEILVLPGVFDGVRLRSGAFLAQTLAALAIRADAHVLDLGTGSGIGAIADRG